MTASSNKTKCDDDRYRRVIILAAVDHRLCCPPGVRPRLDGGESRDLPASDVLRLPRASSWQQPPIHGAVRTADQPVQRENLHDPLVLDGVRCRCQRPQSYCVAHAHNPAWRSHEVHTEPSRGSGHDRDAQRQRAMRRLSRQLPATRRRLHPATGRAQHGQHHDDGDHLLAVEVLDGEGEETKTHVQGRFESGRGFRTGWRRYAADEVGRIGRTLEVV